MYTLIGYRPHITPAAASNISQVLGHTYSEQLIGIACHYLPDFAIFWRDGKFYEVIRGELVEIAEPTSEFTTYKAPYYSPTGLEILAWIREAERLHTEVITASLEAV